MSRATIHIDGGSRGNPGPAAWAYVIETDAGTRLEFAQTLTRATNNVAEYTALIKALKRAAAEKIEDLDIRSDSELLVRQMKGEYRVKSPDLRDLYAAAQALVSGFRRVELLHIRRELNKRADELCNRAMDGRVFEAPGGPALPAIDTASTDLAPVLHGAAAVHQRCLELLRGWPASGRTAEEVWLALWEELERGGLLKKMGKLRDDGGLPPAGT